MQRSALCRSRRELSNEYLLAKFGFDTAENEPSKDPESADVRDEQPPKRMSGPKRRVDERNLSAGSARSARKRALLKVRVLGSPLKGSPIFCLAKLP